MSKPMTKIFDLATGEEIEREMTAEEIQNLENVQTSAAAEKATQAALEAKKQEILDKLGLTADEAALLLK